MKYTLSRNADTMDYHKAHYSSWVIRVSGCSILKFYSWFKVTVTNHISTVKPCHSRKRSQRNYTGEVRKCYGQGDIRIRWKHFIETSKQFYLLILQSFSIHDFFMTMTFKDQSDYNKVKKLLERFIEKIRELIKEKPVYVLTIEHHKSGAFHLHMILKKPKLGWPRFASKMLSELWKHGHCMVKPVSDLLGMANYMTKEYTEMTLNEYQNLVDCQIRPFHKSKGLKLNIRIMSFFDLQSFLLKNSFIYLKGQTLQVLDTHKVEPIVTLHAFAFITKKLLVSFLRGSSHNVFGYVTFKSLYLYVYRCCYNACLGSDDLWLANTLMYLSRTG